MPFALEPPHVAKDENGENDETNGKADAGVAVDVDLIAESRKKLFAKGKAGGKKKASEPPKKEEEEESKKKSGKAARDWAGQGKLTKEKMEALVEMFCYVQGSVQGRPGFA